MTRRQRAGRLTGERLIHQRCAGLEFVRQWTRHEPSTVLVD